MVSAIVEKVIRRLPNPHAVFPSLDTTYSKYHNTNYAAWGRDIPAIRKILSKQQRQLDDLDTIIKSTQNLLDQLQKKRDQILSSKKTHEGFISSGIRRLPTEILREIFVLCLPWMAYVEPETKMAPLLLTWICRRWREIALDTPELWCSLSLGLNNKRMESEQSLSFYRHWLSNTKSCPLTLDIDVRTPERIPAVTTFSRPYIRRCTELCINYEEAIGLDLLLQDVPMLTYLELIGDMDTMRNTKPISIVQPKRRLRGLAIGAPSFGMDILSMFNPGWTGLTHLSVTVDINWGASTNIDHDSFSTFLRTCPNLEYFIFSPVCLTHPNPVSLTHTRLRTLEIAKLYRRGAIHMGTLTFPSLRNLKVLLDADGDIAPFNAADISESVALDEDMPMEIDATSIASAQQRHCTISIELSFIAGPLLTFFDLGWSSLTHLDVDLYDTASTFLILLQRCTNLEHFSVHALGFFDHGAGAPTSSQTPFTHHRLRSLSIASKTQLDEELLNLVTLPNLRCLSLDFLRPIRWPHHQFRNFLSRSRCPLETLDILGVQEFKEEHRTEFAALIPTLKRLELEVEGGWAYSWAR